MKLLMIHIRESTILITVMKMKKIEIERLFDDYECETCGSSYAEGGIVQIDGEQILERIPRAYCYNDPSFTEMDLLVMSLKQLGIEIIVDDEPYRLTSHDDEYYGHKLEDS